MSSSPASLAIRRVSRSRVPVEHAALPERISPVNDDNSTRITDFFVFDYIITDLAPRTVTYTFSHMNFDVYTDGRAGNTGYRVTVLRTSVDITATVVPLPTAAALAGAGWSLLTLRHRRVIVLY